jgi:dienelactone hydrolase
MKSILTTMLIAIATFAMAQSSTYTVISKELKSPLGITFDANGQFWVTETGTGKDDGSVSILGADGTTIPVITNLPSFFIPDEHEVTGAWRILPLPNNKIALVVGGGPGKNFGTIYFFDLNGAKIPLTLANATRQVPVTAFLATKGMEDSNPFSVAIDAAGNLIVADAAANMVVKFNEKNEGTIIATLPDIKNPTPVGPPFVNQVPTRIITNPKGGFYLATLTGFPFNKGAATIYAMDASGKLTPYKTGMTTITDLVLDAASGDLFALQVGEFAFAPQPGFAANSSKITRIKPDGSTQIVAEGFGPASGMAITNSGSIYVSEVFSGRILRFGGAAETVRNITFRVDMSQQTVSPKGVYFASNQFGNWKPDANKMTKDADGLYAITLPIQQNQEILYKFINGNTWGQNESVPISCAKVNKEGGSDRFYKATNVNETITVCFGSCMSCGDTKPKSVWYDCPKDAIFCDNFESYTTGKLIPQAAKWETANTFWGHQPRTETVSDNPTISGAYNGFSNYDGSKALIIHESAFAELPLNLTAGTYKIQSKIYVPSGKIGTFIVQQGGDDIFDFIVNLDFSTNNGKGEIAITSGPDYDAGKLETTLKDTPLNKWFDLAVTVNLDTKETTIALDGKQVFAKKIPHIYRIYDLQLVGFTPNETLWMMDDLVITKQQAAPPVPIASCDGKRYLYPVFGTNIKKTTVQYGENKTTDGKLQKLYMDVYEPISDKAEKRPVVLMAFGGSFVRGTREDMATICQGFAAQGYVAATIDYRLYPLATLGAPTNPAVILDNVIKPIGDMKAAIRYFRQDAATANIFKADANNIMAGGVSAGAITAIHVGILDKSDILPPALQAILAANGGLEGNSGSAENAKYSSAIKAIINLSGGVLSKDWYGKGDPALVSMHGEADATVPFKSGLAERVLPLDGSFLLHQQATANGIPNLLVSVPGGGHTDIYLDPKFKPFLEGFTAKSAFFLHSLVCPGVAPVTSFNPENAVIALSGMNNNTIINTYPNPSTDFMTVSLASAAELRVISVEGKILKTIQTQGNVSLDKADYGTGVFFLQIIQNGESVTKKINFR